MNRAERILAVLLRAIALVTSLAVRAGCSMPHALDGRLPSLAGPGHAARDALSSRI